MTEPLSDGIGDVLYTEAVHPPPLCTLWPYLEVPLAQLVDLSRDLLWLGTAKVLHDVHGGHRVL